MLKIATYNILHGYHKDLILKNLETIIQKGSAVICIQEADVSFKSSLNSFLKSKNWEVVYFHTNKACNLATAWNPAMLTLQNAENILLPTIKKPVFIQRLLRHNEKLQRGAIIVQFLLDGKTVRVTNVHLSWEGGIKHRLSQLAAMSERLDKKKLDFDILAGDFNTFALSLFRRIQEKKVEKLLWDWGNVFPGLAWTCDISSNAPQDGYDLFAKACRLFEIKFRSRLDYIFTKNLEVIYAEMLDLPGSDHRPLMASLKVH